MHSQSPARNLTSGIQIWQLRIGVMLFASALAGTIAVRELAVHSPLRYALFVPFVLAFHALHLGVTGVCGLSAAQGVRRTEDGAEPMLDRRELHKVRRRGAAVFASTVVCALIVTVSLVH